MSKNLLTPRQVMYRLEKFEENENKLKEYKQTLKKELNRLRKVESRYKKHIKEHSKYNSNEAPNFKNESILKHHRHQEVFDIPSDISKEFVLVYNFENKIMQNIVENLNIRCVVFKVDDLSNDDIINNKLLILNDKTQILQEFIEFNKENIYKIFEISNIETINQLNKLRLKIKTIIENT